MNARILRIELRRTIAPWAALAAVVVAFGFLFSFTGPWTRFPLAWNEHWTFAAEWSRFLLVFLWPIAIGAGVLQGMRDSRSGMVELLATMPRPGRHRAAKLAGALGGLLTLGYLLVFAVGAIQVLFHGGFFTIGWLPIVVVGALAMVAGAWIGLGIGRLLPHPLTAPAVAITAFVAVVVFQVVPSEGSAFEGALPIRLTLLSPAMDVFNDPFMTTAGRMDIGQAVWLAGLAATGFLLLAAGTKRAKALAAVPALVAVAIAVPVLPATTAEAKVVDPLATAMVCDGPVCLTKMHEADLARVAGPGKEALRLLGTLPGAPTKIVELDRRLGYDEVPPRAADTMLIDLLDWSLRLSTEPKDVTRALVAGVGTPSCHSVRGGGRLYLNELTARTIAASWFLGEWKPLRGTTLWTSEETKGEITQAWEAFRALPPDVQRTRIIAQRQAGLTCQGDQLEILTGGQAR
ncbi:hypothetical protein [Amycolatopsis pittospori]|uniref:hypothetical protein n=1 Tax=Amycolatopsis pittospori TaxID=2749434 RepID=UPI0015F00CAB|nr:hypothetical protein [Amycolatopsis pittospori]